RRRSVRCPLRVRLALPPERTCVWTAGTSVSWPRAEEPIESTTVQLCSSDRTPRFVGSWPNMRCSCNARLRRKPNVSLWPCVHLACAWERLAELGSPHPLFHENTRGG